MIKFRSILLSSLLGGVASLSGCSALAGRSCLKPPTPEEAGDLSPLHVPVGLDAPDTREALKIPPLEQPAVPPDPSHCLEEPPMIVPLVPPSKAERDAEKKDSGKRQPKPVRGRPGL
jgi:uncharacterized lipoprotein